MDFIIKHETKARMRVHLPVKRLTFREADTLAFYLDGFPEIREAKVYERTADAVIVFDCDRARAVEILRSFSFEGVKVPESVFESSSREQSAEYFEKLVTSTILHYAMRLLLPSGIDRMRIALRSIKFIKKGLHTLAERRLKVELLDAVAIGAAVLTKDRRTASSVMFLLDVGDVLEEWTHKRSVDDLARRMSLNIDKVWRLTDDGEVQADAADIRLGDQAVVRMGNMIPFDGEVTGGEAMVNQASMTGESVPVRKSTGASVFAGTLVEEGELTVCVTKTSGCGRFDAIVKMIEESEKLKSTVESKAARLADKLVPYTLFAAGATWLFTGNTTKAVSVLMVDYSCALKMTMPIAVLSAIRETADYHITVKGGRFMELFAEADTIVFDKTGTLTEAKPTVIRTVSFCGESEDELLRQAACLEEHFPHSAARAVVDAAAQKGLSHEEMHTMVEYIVAHGIASRIDGKRVVIGSGHFVFEDEGVTVPLDKKELLDSLGGGYSRLYFAKEGVLCACILIDDPMRPETPEVIRELKALGISHIVMMTGDSRQTAEKIAKKAGIDEFYAEVLPEDKAAYVEKAGKAGHRVIMVGDGINDSPALSAADVGVAISDAADIARQIADITINASDIKGLIALRKLSAALMRRIHFNYRTIAGFNTALIALGIVGILPPATSALLHNGSTVGLSLYSMTPLCPTK